MSAKEVEEEGLSFGFSHIPGSPSFRNSAVNAVAIIPLLQSSSPSKVTNIKPSNGGGAGGGEGGGGDVASGPLEVSAGDRLLPPPPSSSSSSHSSKSFANLLRALARRSTALAPGSNNNTPSSTPISTTDTPATTVTTPKDSLLWVVPHSSLTRPGDWRYGATPLPGFHWQHGCQRLQFFDGRPQHSRIAHDKLLNPMTGRDWIDLAPSRRTAAVVGILNLKDCTSLEDLHRAEEELHHWANRYATPPYEVTALGRNFDRDRPLERLFVFDSFDDDCQRRIDLSQSHMENSILAFPPVDGNDDDDPNDTDAQQRLQMMDLHLNVVVNDLAVSIFRQLEDHIVASDAISALNVAVSQAAHEPPSNNLQASARLSLTKFMAGTGLTTDGATASATQSAITAANATSASSSTTTGTTQREEPVSAASRALSLSSIAGLVSPDSKLAKESPTTNTKILARIPSGLDNTTATSAAMAAAAATSSNNNGTSGGVALSSAHQSSSFQSSVAASANTNLQKANSSPKLITPLDAFWERGGLSSRDVDAIRRRDVARREKWAGDLSLLAGSPLDAYERYVKAAELCKASGTPDPLWYASALEGCAASHIAMAEAGGYGVDEYLENNFQMPDEVMALARDDAAARRSTSNSAATSKQTLPEVVCALCEEALNITNRHEKLGAFHAELLLKLACYIAESSEGHLRCRWGEGEGCYAGDADDVPRWQKPSVYRLKLSDLKSSSGLDDMVAINSYNRTKQVCELLHEAVSIGSLDFPTRVDVAACCVRVCLAGVKATQWKETTMERVKLPRKAAFFAVVAAEAMTCAKGEGGDQTSRDLWYFATQLYSTTPNSPSVPGKYGWAGLRAITLNALALQGNNAMALQAADELLWLLGEITPPRNLQGTSIAAAEHTGRERSSHGGKAGPSTSHGVGSSHGKSPQTSNQAIQTSGHGGKPSAPSVPSAIEQSFHVAPESVRKASAFAKQLRDSFTTLTAGSSILVMESRWADGEAVSCVDVPLSAATSQPLGCVWRIISSDKCCAAQLMCTSLIHKLHRSLPTDSSVFETNSSNLPIAISSELSIQLDPDLELERAKKEVKIESDDPMATFFNPFANKRSSKSQSTVVAEGEERAMRVELSNQLSIPIPVVRCQLDFRSGLDGRVKSTPLSFTIPPKATRFPVHFPFCILPSDDSLSPDASAIFFELNGIKLTFAGRVFSLPLNPVARAAGGTPLIPPPVKLYHRYTSKAKSNDTSEDGGGFDVLRIEACPTQPRLQVCLAKTGAVLSSDRPIHVSLANGEVYTLPVLRIKNYLGPGGFGAIERLQIYAVDLPSSSDKKVFDTHAEVPNDFDFAFMAAGKEQPPLKIRCLAESLHLSKLNASHGEGGEGSLVTIQIAASRQLKARLPKGALIRIRFRYRGAPGVANEFWRRREFSLHVSCISGPRISSLDFRPDLLRDCAYADMCRVLRKEGGNSFLGRTQEKPRLIDVDESDSSVFDLRRVGMDKGIHVASDTAAIVVTIANETDSELTIRKEDGSPVGGFLHSPLPKMAVHTGVSAKFPVFAPRVSRLLPNANASDLAKQIISLVDFEWEVLRGDSQGGALKNAAKLNGDQRSEEMARGRLQIPLACLVDIVERQPSLVARICEPPCRIDLVLQGIAIEASAGPKTKIAVEVAVGQPLQVCAAVGLAPWIPLSTAEQCDVAIQFLCARQGSRHESSSEDDERAASSPPPPRDFVWCGKPQQWFPAANRRPTSDSHASDDENALRHRLAMVFCAPGTFVVSSCVRLRQNSRSLPSPSAHGVDGDEVWLAPTAALVRVTPYPGQRDAAAA